MQKVKSRELFAAFFRIGLFTFGGGYAMIPLIERDVVTKKQWMKDEDLLDMVALAESTPGPVAVNAATFVGRQVGGYAGAAAATLGVVLPSFLIILAVGYLLQMVMHSRLVRDAFLGIRASVLVLIASAMISLLRKMQWSKGGICLLIAALTAVAFFDVSPILVLLAAAGAGIAAGAVRRLRA
ncbi:chromate transporter [Chordicoccus furentiruminis]|uniref:chromate transporter n=1 Tax=Chordicoccus furentiruminis TaxID=2709410 RepID=UPI0023A897B1|nr:chromate transporter [Chordicoccus furentiruminis]